VDDADGPVIVTYPNSNLHGDDSLDEMDEEILDRAWEDVIREDEEEMAYRRNFLLYWSPDRVEAHMRSECDLEFISGGQLGAIEEGDVVLVVTVNKDGELLLVGRLPVGEIADYRRVTEITGATGIEKAEFYAIAESPLESELLEINLGNKIGDIRFAGSDAILELENGCLPLQQLEPIRELDTDTAVLLHKLWIDEAEKQNQLKYFPSGAGDSHSDPNSSGRHLEGNEAGLPGQRDDFLIEKVLTFVCEGGGADIYRQKSESGRLEFFAEGGNVDYEDEEEANWRTEASESLIESIKSQVAGYKLFLFQPIFIHPEHRSVIKEYLDNLYAALTQEEANHLQESAQYSPVTPDKWIAAADERMNAEAAGDARLFIDDVIKVDEETIKFKIAVKEVSCSDFFRSLAEDEKEAFYDDASNAGGDLTNMSERSREILASGELWLQAQQVKDTLKTARRVFVLTGAGVSAESGVPTFRGGGGAPVWRDMPFEKLSSAQMVNTNLPLLWEWFDYRRGLVSDCEPNAAHITLSKVQQSGRFEEFSLVTQNIDGLHQASGTANILELHGSLWQARCLSCRLKQSLREIPSDERPPVCPECFDSMRPDVVLFGEAMPVQAVYEAQKSAENCDVCIVVGTSALVYPAAELPLIAKRAGAIIIEINPEETALSEQSDISLRGKAAEILPQIFAAAI